LSAIGNQIGVAIEKAGLYENLKNAYQELKEAQEQVIAQEKLASLGKLSATIAHEINNPLAAVLTYNRLMIKQNRNGRLTPGRKDDIARYLDHHGI
jgi:two-component system NtrC family sensor kinase